MPDGGNVSDPERRAHAFATRASDDGELIFLLTDERRLRLALNLLLNLEEFELYHHVVVASTSAVCSELWARARRIGLSLGCVTSSFLRRGMSARTDAGLDAYGFADDHVYHLWWARWFVLSAALELGYRVLLLDTDVAIRANPYPLLHGALAHHTLITGVGDDQDAQPFSFPDANVGFLYARGPPGGGAHWVVRETRLRLERLLAGEVIPWPRRQGQTQLVLWEQDVFKDALETSAFTPAAPSWRHAQTHCLQRDGLSTSAGRRAPPLPADWALRRERLRFFARVAAPLPSMWLPLHVPEHGAAVAARRDASSMAAAPSTSATRDATADAKACNRSAGSERLWNPWSGDAGTRMGGAGRSGSYAAVPMWLFSSYGICPHGNTCEGRWGWTTPSIVAAHLVGVRAKFWILRALGWWHYDAARPLPSAAATPATPATSAASAAATPAAPAAVFPARVRPLVLRGHSLRLAERALERVGRDAVARGKRARRGNDVQHLQVQLARWALLALALGRTAVLPNVPCEIPTMDVPPRLQRDIVLVKLTDTARCDAHARATEARLAASVPPIGSHQRLRVTAEMGAMGDYSNVTQWPPPKMASCCQLLPAVKCVDPDGGSGRELHEELLLGESDLGHLVREERSRHARSDLGHLVHGESTQPAVRSQRTERTARGRRAANRSSSVASMAAAGSATIQPVQGQSLSLHAMRAHTARTLVVDLDPEQARRALPLAAWFDTGDRVRVRGDLDDPLALLPRTADVQAAVRRRLARRTDDRRSRKCIEHLLAIAAGPATPGESQSAVRVRG